MTHRPSRNRLRVLRAAKQLSQADLAGRAGISRTAVTAIEAGRVVPSVAVALALSKVLACSVEELFGGDSPSEVWAWTPRSLDAPRWSAQVGDRRVLYPADATPMWTPLPVDNAAPGSLDHQTLVMASCDPAAGLLASLYAASTGARMLVLPRSSREALGMLRDGLVHVAGVHFATKDSPDGNIELAREMIGGSFRMARVALWQEGIALSAATRVRSVRAATRSKLVWAGREAGSAARHCQDQLLGSRRAPRRLGRGHRGVAEAVRSSWADAGVCVQLVCAEAGLTFLPVQEEAYDVCFASSSAQDHGIQALLHVLQSAECRKLIGGLPGYDTRETGEHWEVN